MWLEVIICVLAGAGAGIGTGFAGLSAAVFISPMLVAFLGTPVYEAVGIALASDVLASAISAVTYGKEGNIDLKQGKPLLFSVLFFAIAGSILAFFITNKTNWGDTILGYWSIIASILLGILFLFKKTKQRERKPLGTGRLIVTILCGVYIGFLCGFQGTGGGMMMLFVLTTVMRYDFKSAVGTSVFIMAFTALIGAISHFIANGFPDLGMMMICMLSTLAFAQVSAILANKLNDKKLNLITGILLSVSGIVMLLAKIFLKS